MAAWSPIRSKEDLPPPETRESEWLEFKEAGYGDTDTDRLEVARDVAQFANHLGGTILLGVQEDAGRAVAYPGLPDLETQERRIRDTCLSRLEPCPRFETLPITPAVGNPLLALNVFPSDGPVAVRMAGTDRYEFPVRSSSRRTFLRFEEVVRMVTPERRARLLLETIPVESRQKIRLDIEGGSLAPGRRWSLKEVGASYLTLQTPGDWNVRLPLRFVEAVWPSDEHGEYTVIVDGALKSSGGGPVFTRRSGR